MSFVVKISVEKCKTLLVQMENSHPTVTAKEVALEPATAARQPLSLAQRRTFMQLSLEEDDDS